MDGIEKDGFTTKSKSGQGVAMKDFCPFCWGTRAAPEKNIVHSKLCPAHHGPMRPCKANPKDLLGIRKIQLGLLPGAGKIYGALAMQDGAKKYGPYNWRSKKVRMTVYLDAMERHLLALLDGQNNAPDSGVPHLGCIIACASILADAVEGGFLIDDRPTAGPAAAIIEREVAK